MPTTMPTMDDRRNRFLSDIASYVPAAANANLQDIEANIREVMASGDYARQKKFLDDVMQYVPAVRDSDAKPEDVAANIKEVMTVVAPSEEPKMGFLDVAKAVAKRVWSGRDESMEPDAVTGAAPKDEPPKEPSFVERTPVLKQIAGVGQSFKDIWKTLERFQGVTASQVVNDQITAGKGVVDKYGLAAVDSALMPGSERKTKIQQYTAHGIPAPDYLLNPPKLTREEINSVRTYSMQDELKPMVAREIADFQKYVVDKKDKKYTAWQKETEEATKYITGLGITDVANPANWGKISDSALTIVAQQAPNILSGLVPAVMVATEAENFIENATTLGLDDLDIASKYGMAYSVPSAVIEFGSSYVLMGGGKVLDKVAGGITKPIKGAIMKIGMKGIAGALSMALGRTVAGGIVEGLEEVTQGELQDMLTFVALGEAAKKHPEKAAFYGEKQQAMRDRFAPKTWQGLLTWLSTRAPEFVIGGIAGMGFRGAVETYGAAKPGITATIAGAKNVAGKVVGIVQGPSRTALEAGVESGGANVGVGPSAPTGGAAGPVAEDSEAIATEQGADWDAEVEALVTDKKNKKRGTRGMDPLYGIENRTAYVEDLDAARRTGQVATGFIDTVNQKKLNDLLGHEGADEILREINQVESEAMEKASKEQGVAVKRYRTGGDERGVIAPGATAEQLSKVLEPVRQAVDEFIASRVITDNKGRQQTLGEATHARNLGLRTGAGAIIYGTADNTDVDPNSKRMLTDMMKLAEERGDEQGSQRSWERARKQKVDTGTEFVYNIDEKTFEDLGAVVGRIEAAHPEWKSLTKAETQVKALQVINESGAYEFDPASGRTSSGGGASSVRIPASGIQEGGRPQVPVVTQAGNAQESGKGTADRGTARRTGEGSYEHAVRIASELTPEDRLVLSEELYRTAQEEGAETPPKFVQEAMGPPSAPAPVVAPKPTTPPAAPAQGELPGIEDTRSDTQKAIVAEQQRRSEKAKKEDKGLSGTPMSTETQDVADQVDIFHQKENQPTFEELIGEEESLIEEEGDAAVLGMVSAKNQPVSPPSPVAPDMIEQLTRAPEPRSLENILNRKDRPVAVNQVLKTLAALGKVPIRVGHFAKRGVLGIFKGIDHKKYGILGEHIIRLAEANNIVTATHEVGHALFEVYIPQVCSNAKDKLKFLKGAKSELVKAGRALYGNKKPNGGYAREGAAQHMRFLLLNGEEQASAAFPIYHKWFVDEVTKNNPELKKLLSTARAQIKNYQDQGAIERVGGFIEFGDVSPGFVAKLLKTFSKRGVISELDPLHKIDAMAASIIGRDLRPDETVGLTAQAFKYTHEAVANFMVEDGMVDWQGQKIGPALKEAAALVGKKNRRLFAIYMIAKRALFLHSTGRTSGISQEDAKEIVKKLTSENFERAADMVYEWTDGVLNYVKQADPSMAPLIDKFKSAKETCYMPFARIFEVAGEEEAVELASEYAKTRGTGYKRLFGGGQRIRDPFRVLIEQTSRRIRDAHDRVVIHNLLNFADLPGMGRYIENITPQMEKKSVALRQFKNEIEDILNIVTDGEFTEIGKEVDLDQVLSYFVPATQYRGKEPILTIRGEDGKNKWYQVHPALYDALSKNNLPRVGWALNLLGVMPNRIFKTTVTGLRPVFALRNPLRDFRSFMMNTHSNKNPLQLAAEWCKQQTNAMGSFLGMTEENPYHELYRILGLEMSQSLSVDTPASRRAANQIFEGKTARFFKDPLDAINNFLQVTEGGTRSTELKSVAEQVGWKPGMPLTLNQRISLMIAAKRATVDFTQTGSWTKFANMFVPFMTANISGSTQFYARTLGKHQLGKGIAELNDKRNRLAVVLKGVSLLTLPTLALWYRNKDKEWYKKMRWRDKFAYFNIEVGDEIIRIPRAPDVDNLFTVLPESMFDAFYQKDPEGATKAFEHIFSTTVPPMVPQSLRPVTEQLANYQFYFKRPIEAASQSSLPLEERYGPYSSKLAIFLGEKMKWSPERIDHLIRGYGGGLTTDLIEWVGLGSASSGMRQREPADIPVLGTFFTRGGTTALPSRIVDQVHEEYKKVYRLSRSRIPDKKYDEEVQGKIAIFQNAIESIGECYTAMQAEKNMDRETHAMYRELMNDFATNALEAGKLVEEAYKK